MNITLIIIAYLTLQSFSKSHFLLQQLRHIRGVKGLQHNRFIRQKRKEKEYCFAQEQKQSLKYYRI